MSLTFYFDTKSSLEFLRETMHLLRRYDPLRLDIFDNGIFFLDKQVEHV